MLDSSQSGVDGVGLPKIITNSFAVRLKAKDIQVQKETFLMPFNKNFITSVDTKNKNLYVKNIQDYIE